MGSRPRRMTLPVQPGRIDPIYKPAQTPALDPAHGAAFILLHGFDDTAEGLENIADQFQANSKLTHMNWIIPNAMENRDAMRKAWYTPHNLSPVPDDRPELEPEEDEVGLFKSVAYVESLIDACVNKGIPPNRIVLGGFSQGAALSLLTDLVSKKYGGKLAAVIGLMGYLPLARGRRIEDLRARAGLPANTGNIPVFIARDEKDRMVPMRTHQRSIQRLNELGFTAVEVHEYQGLDHNVNGAVLKDVCSFLEQHTPKLED